MIDHTFVVCAYGQSEYLTECLESLKNQSHPSKIVISTSTPSIWLDEIARNFGVPIYINPEKPGIASDWNFGFSAVESEYITLAHQDDVFHLDYDKNLFSAIQKNPDNLIIFCNSGEIHNARIVRSNLNLIVKRLLLLLMYMRPALRTRRTKRMILSFGNPINCPSVTYHKSLFPHFRFSEEYTINLDWDAWLRFADMQGSFVYLKRCLFLHRVHSQSETSNGLKDNRRQNEDKLMFDRLWPKAISKLISTIYTLSYKSNSN